jgi:hypothetical protein
MDELEKIPFDAKITPEVEAALDAAFDKMAREPQTDIDGNAIPSRVADRKAV